MIIIIIIINNNNNKKSEKVENYQDLKREIDYETMEPKEY